jgi:hypothetical protein
LQQSINPWVISNYYYYFHVCLVTNQCRFENYLVHEGTKWWLIGNNLVKKCNKKWIISWMNYERTEIIRGLFISDVIVLMRMAPKESVRGLNIFMNWQWAPD